MDRDRYSRDEKNQSCYAGELTVSWIGIDTVEMRGAIMQVNSYRYSRGERSHCAAELTVGWKGIDTVEMRRTKVIMQVNSLYAG